MLDTMWFSPPYGDGIDFFLAWLWIASFRPLTGIVLIEAHAKAHGFGFRPLTGIVLST